MTEMHTDHFNSLFQSGKYSDLKINCGNGAITFRVHKNVVCTQSKVLAAHIDNPFLV